MSLQQIKNLKSEKGFTIVELLIVIVVIGILAAIVIVAFNGVQNRAKTQSSQAAASGIQKKLEAFNAATTNYPVATSYSAMETELNGQPESKIDTGITLGTPTNANTKTVGIFRCNVSGTTAFSVVWYDFGASGAKAAIDGLKVGATCGTNIASNWTALT